MEKITHVLNMSFGIDFSKILSEPFKNGVKLTLNIQEDDQVIEAYGKYLHDIILSSIEDRQEINSVSSELYPAVHKDEEADRTQTEASDSTEPYLEKLDHDDTESVSDNDEIHYDTMLEENLNEISHMPNMTIEKMLVKKGVEFSNLDFEDSIEVVTDINSFEEDSHYGVDIPYKLILKNNKTDEQTTILGGF
ncbi:hypothetical protein [Enterococcus mundtii]|uniref:hypothetical protein n=1 Tax=Enterococcus mundtii TaxID=53346 RepID=UPI001A964052|nr:hypothetical protein [Enterococcus mundtii]MBO1087169.1 hypothetical protein [Enterococcus mundtii]